MAEGSTVAVSTASAEEYSERLEIGEALAERRLLGSNAVVTVECSLV